VRLCDYGSCFEVQAAPQAPLAEEANGLNDAATWGVELLARVSFALPRPHPQRTDRDNGTVWLPGGQGLLGLTHLRQCGDRVVNDPAKSAR
jgi:hypothetical protein